MRCHHNAARRVPAARAAADRLGSGRWVWEVDVPDMVCRKSELIAKTESSPPADVPWETDAEGGEALAEFAGRACYQSWKKPNPATATNAGYLRHILEVGHLSVL